MKGFSIFRIQFAPVFISLFLGTAFIIAALLVNQHRPEIETDHPTARLVAATGKCASCHRRETAAIVHQFETSRHAAAEVNCLSCHQPADGQESVHHRGFDIAKQMTAKNCASCHATEYDQFLRSRHAAPAWAAVRGSQDFSAEQIAQGEKYHKGAVMRPPNALALTEGHAAFATGCNACHSIGKPNDDGSIGNCTQCHSRHSSSIALARQPETCGQCHMGPDHAQLEIYNESKHGVIFAAQRHTMRLAAEPKSLTTADMPVPTCATCHMSGLNGLKVTHDLTERLSWYLFSPISKKRPGYQRGQTEMQEVCLQCHAKLQIETMYKEAEVVVAATNEKVGLITSLLAELRKEGLLTPEPFDEPIEFLVFDYWHYYGRTAKHGAFMGGADFVQWHGNYELLKVKVEILELARQLRENKDRGD